MDVTANIVAERLNNIKKKKFLIDCTADNSEYIKSWLTNSGCPDFDCKIINIDPLCPTEETCCRTIKDKIIVVEKTVTCAELPSTSIAPCENADCLTQQQNVVFYGVSGEIPAGGSVWRKATISDVSEHVFRLWVSNNKKNFKFKLRFNGNEFFRSSWLVIDAQEACMSCSDFVNVFGQVEGEDISSQILNKGGKVGDYITGIYANPADNGIAIDIALPCGVFSDLEMKVYSAWEEGCNNNGIDSFCDNSSFATTTIQCL